jgi:hypothetical protein
MSYTWEEVMFGIDVKNEQARKAEDKRRIEQEAADESSAAGWWSLGLSILGGALFGPAGYLIGKKAGEWGADIAHPWEEMTMEEGKFDTGAAKDFNKTLKEAAKDQTEGQILNTILDLGKMYVQGGGLTAKPGELDLFTYGSGEDAWTVFSEESKIPFLKWDVPGKQLPVGQSLLSPERGVIDNLFTAFTKGSALVGQDKAIQGGADLARLLLESGKQDKEKPKGTSFPVQSPNLINSSI